VTKHNDKRLAARGESPAAFERRCIPPDCVAPPSNIPDILGRHALPGGRLAVLGATPDFHHGLLGQRRGFRRCMAGVGAGVMLMAGGVLKGMPIAQAAHGAEPGAGGLRFVRVADAALEDGGQAAADGTHVVVDNFSFAPATATIPVGTTVTWTNRDDIPHNVVSPEQKFKSQVLDTNEKFSHTFAVAGTYKYYCSIHPRMTGQVVVR
jgi:plastocyanin